MHSNTRKGWGSRGGFKKTGSVAQGDTVRIDDNSKDTYSDDKKQHLVNAQFENTTCLANDAEGLVFRKAEGPEMGFTTWRWLLTNWGLHNHLL